MLPYPALVDAAVILRMLSRAHHGISRLLPSAPHFLTFSFTHPLSLFTTPPTFLPRVLLPPHFHWKVAVISFSLLRVRLITKTSKQVERWTESSAINSGSLVDWCGHNECTHARTNTRTQGGDRGQCEPDNEEVGSALNGGCLTLTNKPESLKVGLHLLWPQFFISPAGTHMHEHRPECTQMSICYSCCFPDTQLEHTYTHAQLLAVSLH